MISQIKVIYEYHFTHFKQDTNSTELLELNMSHTK